MLEAFLFLKLNRRFWSTVDVATSDINRNNADQVVIDKDSFSTSSESSQD